jgi:hypothetical protein
MMHAVKTTHAVPKKLAALRLVKKTSPLTCAFCAQTIGAYSTPAERAVLETRHACKEKLMTAAPLAALPFH